MRRTLFGVFLVTLCCAPAAMAKQEEEPKPLFMAPDFHFSQIDTICLAPSIDLRTDKSFNLPLSTAGPRVGFLYAPHLKSVDTVLPRDFETIGYPTVNCGPVKATLNDLKSPTEAWLHTLEFGTSRYLFLLAVEDVHVYYRHEWIASESYGGYTVLSGLLFERQAAAVKLDWRDRVVGWNNSPQTLQGRAKEAHESAQSDIAILQGAKMLLMKFETRNKRMKIGSWLSPRVVSYEEDVACAVLWPTLDGVLKNSGKYEIIGSYDSDMMAIYYVGRGLNKEENSWNRRYDRINYAVLRNEQNRCTMQVTDLLGLTRDPDALNKRVQAALGK